MKLKSIFVTAASAISAFQLFAADVKDGDKIILAGDYFYSGVDIPSRSGYTRFLGEALKANNLKVELAPETTPMSADALKTKIDEILAKKPNVLVVSTGSYDVFGVPLDRFKSDITDIVDKAVAAKVKLIFLTGRPTRDNKIAPCNEFLRSIAAEKGCGLVDVFALIESELKRRGAPEKKNVTVNIGYSFVPSVNVLIAEGIIKSIKFSDEQLAASKKAWDSLPDACELLTAAKMSFERYDRMLEAAEKNGKSGKDFSEDALKKGIEKALSKP